MQLRSITPRQLARGVLVVGVFGIVAWVTASAWSQLLPFQLGLILAYITLPVVNWLDRFMPRFVAASLMVLVEFAALVGIFALVVPPLISEVTQLLDAIPDAS